MFIISQLFVHIANISYGTAEVRFAASFEDSARSHFINTVIDNTVNMHNIVRIFSFI